LAESEEKYRALAENTLDGIIIIRFDGTGLYANRAMVRMADLDDAAEAVNKNVFDFIAPSSREKVREDLRYMEQGAAGFLATYPAMTARGRECWFECLSTTINYLGERVNISSIRDITDKLRKDRELIIRENAMATSIGGMAVFNPNLMLVYANQSFLALFRFKDEHEVLGKNVYDLIRGWEMMEGVLEDIKTTLAERGEWSGEVCYPKKDSGSDRYLRISAKNVTDTAGSLVCTVTSFADVTEQRVMEDAFKRTYGKLQETIEFMPDPTFIVNQKKEVVAWNHAMETLTGIQKTEILQSRDYHSAFAFYQGHRPVLIDLIDLPAEELGRTYPTVRRVGDSIFSEAYLPHLNQGKGAYLWGKASRLIDEKGKPIGAIESVRDITEWKRAEESLRHVYQQTQNAARDE
ncbi:MAG: PAS domain S-box protein, partial [Methanobacteriota archaeon]